MNTHYAALAKNQFTDIQLEVAFQRIWLLGKAGINRIGYSFTKGIHPYTSLYIPVHPYTSLLSKSLPGFQAEFQTGISPDFWQKWPFPGG